MTGCPSDGGGGEEDTESATDTGPSTSGLTTSTTTATATTGTDTDDPTTDTDSTGTDTDDQPRAVYEGPTKGGSIATNEAGDRLAVANKATGDVTLFSIDGTQEPVELARLDVGAEPTSVVFSPGPGAELYVVSRAAGTVTKIVGADSDAPTVDGTVSVGSEPSLGAPSPTAAHLYVSNWADGTLSVVDTETMDVTETIDVGGAPYAVCVTNDLDDDDDDETVYVTDFYGLERIGDEATDGGRNARVFAVSADDHSIETLTLRPLPDAGIPETGGAGAFPNQLYSCVINDEHLYVTGVGASPEPLNSTTDFRQNVHGLVHAFDLETGEQDDDRTVNLNALVDALLPPKRFVAVAADIAFAPNSDFGYVASMAAQLAASSGLVAVTAGRRFSLGSQFPPDVGIAPPGVDDRRGPRPTSTTRSRGPISVVDLAAQQTVHESIASAGAAGNRPKRQDVVDRVSGSSTRGWRGGRPTAGCRARHVTRLGRPTTSHGRFPAGPRQSIDLTATFDCVGLRAADPQLDCDLRRGSRLRAQHPRRRQRDGGDRLRRTALNADGSPNLACPHRLRGTRPSGPDPHQWIQSGVRGCGRRHAEPFPRSGIRSRSLHSQSLRSPRWPNGPTQGDPVAGRQVFIDADCHNCHGGPLWTLSERYYSPLLDTDASSCPRWPRRGWPMSGTCGPTRWRRPTPL